MRTSVVIPAWNEETRIVRALEDLAEKASGGMGPVAVAEVIVVDDGSLDRTTDVAESFRARLPGLRVMRFDDNRGKGAAVRAGFAAATSPWVLVADADLSTPWECAADLARAVEGGADAAIGSRDTRGSRIERRQHWVRERLGRSFNWMVRGLVGLPFKDTQCGFKLFRREAFASLLPRFQVDRFAWDVEWLLWARAAGLRVVEVPVQWAHVDESRVRIFRDGMEMALAVVTMRARIWREARGASFGSERTGRSEPSASPIDGSRPDLFQ